MVCFVACCFLIFGWLNGLFWEFFTFQCFLKIGFTLQAFAYKFFFCLSSNQLLAQVAETKIGNCQYLHWGVSYIRCWICEVSQGMILDMECLCNYKAGLKLTTRNLKWDIENKTSVSQSIIFHYKHHLWKNNVESNLTLISEDVFFSDFPKEKMRKIASLLLLSSPNKNWLDWDSKPFRRHREPVFTQNLSCLAESSWHSNGKPKHAMLWKSMETMGEETYQDDFDWFWVSIFNFKGVHEMKSM